MFTTPILNDITFNGLRALRTYINNSNTLNIPLQLKKTGNS